MNTNDQLVELTADECEQTEGGIVAAIATGIAIVGAIVGGIYAGFNWGSGAAGSCPAPAGTNYDAV